MEYSGACRSVRLSLMTMSRSVTTPLLTFILVLTVTSAPVFSEIAAFSSTALTVPPLMLRLRALRVLIRASIFS